MSRSIRIVTSHKGFSIVELLVAMAIGIIVVAVIGQVMAVSEEQKRAATTGADAMVNGALALYTIERDVKSAGYGMATTLGSLGCEVRAKFGGNPTFSFSLNPIAITNGVNGAPDSIRVLASNKQGVALPTRITVDHPKTAANFFVESDVGVQEGDLMIAVPADPDASNWCSVFQVTGTGGSGGGGGGGGGGQGQNQVLHNSGLSEWNQPGGSTIFPNAGYQKDSYLINLGQFLDHTYDINSNNLRLTDFVSVSATTTTLNLYPQIVQLQAVYGKDTNNDCIVDAWNATQPTTSAEWQQIRAVRVAIVARSQIAEKTTTTLTETDVPAASRCNTAAPNANIVCWRPDPANAATGVEIKLDSTTDWQRYRYRVFDTTIPVRNLVWLQKTENATCDI